MKDISVVISAFNEEANIARALASVSWVKERIVIDNESSDKTAEIARKYKATVYSRMNNPMLNVNKNFGFEKANSSWILNLDADEEVPDALAKEIMSLPSSDLIVGYWIPRKNIIFGKWIEHGLWWPDKQLRLFRKGHGEFPCKHVHEYLQIEGKTEELHEPYTHYNYTSVSQYIRKMDTIYSSSNVENLMASGYRFSWYDAIRFPVSDFVKIYFAQGGYKDGLHGLVLSMLQAFYSFIVFAKYWEALGFHDVVLDGSQISKELHHAAYEIEYWNLTRQLENAKNPIASFVIRLKRKLTHVT